jgi:A/G-specific adenine glycosylase
MLQQTQVVTVLPYYKRFLLAFPTVQSLASAKMNDVLKLWQGLGYYARARNLWFSARKIVSQFGGTLPATISELRTLSGIGRSTAGDILNIAFGQRHPMLDGNVKRILIRYFCIFDDPKDKTVDAELWRLSEAMLPKENINYYTQAIMDLGATLCLPKMPKCDCCPVSSSCQGYQKGVQNNLPIMPVRKKTPHYDYVCAVIQKKEKVLIKKRKETGLLGGLWEFPCGRVTDMNRSFNEIIATEIGQEISLIPLEIKIKHAFTHFKMTFHLFSGTIRRSTEKLPLKWVSIDCLKEYPFSSAHQKIILKLPFVKL